MEIEKESNNNNRKKKFYVTNKIQLLLPSKIGTLYTYILHCLVPINNLKSQARPLSFVEQKM